ncbi:MAG: hypothetical protein SW019_25860 [Actinomycetota bacterium]|nr:hypothetical protein [Actinomycetota bacterium]
MAEWSDHVYAGTRRQLHGLAEGLIAGPQYRSAGTIRLTVLPDGFSGTAVPMSVRGLELVWPDATMPLAGTPRELAEAAGVDFGPPVGVYRSDATLTADAVLDIDAAAAQVLTRCLHAGHRALRRVFPTQHPVLWPEHFDVAVTEGSVNYGVSAGDGYHGAPYAYVGPWEPRTGAFWNAPFGAVYPLDRDRDGEQLTADIAAFFERGSSELSGS